MTFTEADVEELRAILSLCKTVGIDGAVLADGKVMGASTDKKIAIISETKMSIDPKVKVGIGSGRLTDLEKRLGIFTAPTTINTDIGKNGEVARLTMLSGKTKAQFRCTATQHVLHPKENVDTPIALVTLSRTEVTTLVKAAKIFGAEKILFKISAAGAVHIECVDSTNDQFSTDLEKAAEFVDEAETILFTYSSNYLTTVLDIGTRDADSIDLVFGAGGSITALVRGYSLLVLNDYNED
jgi:hypothetical protein